MIKIHTLGGHTYIFQGDYKTIQRALRDIGCHYLVALNNESRRIIVPVKALDSVEEIIK